MPEPNISVNSAAIFVAIVLAYYLGVLIRYLVPTRAPSALSLRHRCLAGILPCLLVVAAMGGIVECVVIRPFAPSMVWSSAFLLFLIVEQGTLLNDFAVRTIQQWRRGL